MLLLSKYDPDLDYDDLAWKVYYKLHRGKAFAEGMKKIIDSCKVGEDVKNKN